MSIKNLKFYIKNIFNIIVAFFVKLIYTKLKSRLKFLVKHYNCCKFRLFVYSLLSKLLKKISNFLLIIQITLNNLNLFIIRSFKIIINIVVKIKIII